ncbi:hypothetical protein Bca52824_014434 [Brassica carinata]|uniref:Transmembrane protein n=1 Tax=Brassica carinata TaxID=52824 RepID=A0A8X7W1D6_BRACI|nr:hypothetical protein Bca52824_014434 [Brassica carinata]
MARASAFSSVGSPFLFPFLHFSLFLRDLSLPAALLLVLASEVPLVGVGLGLGGVGILGTVMWFLGPCETAVRQEEVFET